MPISTHCLEAYVNNCAAASPDCLEVQQLAGVAAALEQAAVGYSVANVASLPSARDNEGRWVFVEDIGAYRYSDGSQWLNVYTTTCRVENRIYGVGDNTYGQLAIGSTVAESNAIREVTNSLWCCVSGEAVFVAGIKNDGTIWSWGCGNVFGTHGNGVNYGCAYSSPVQEICSATNWCHIDRAPSHTVAMKSDGSLWSWGVNGSGQQMLGFCQFVVGSCSPVQEYTSSSWITAGNGEFSVFGIKSDNTLWGAGSNLCGRLGTNDVISYSSPVQEVTSSSWLRVGSNDIHTSAIKTNGTLWSWGFGLCGSLGNNSTLTTSSPVQEASSSTDWCQTVPACCGTAMLKTDGTMWATGWNSNGQYGFGASGSKVSSPVQEISSSTSWCAVYTRCTRTKMIKTDGSLWVLGGYTCYEYGNGLGISGAISSPTYASIGNDDWLQVTGTCTSTIGLRAQVIGFNEP